MAFRIKLLAFTPFLVFSCGGHSSTPSGGSGGDQSSEAPSGGASGGLGGETGDGGAPIGSAGEGPGGQGNGGVSAPATRSLEVYLTNSSDQNFYVQWAARYCAAFGFKEKDAGFEESDLGTVGEIGVSYGFILCEDELNCRRFESKPENAPSELADSHANDSLFQRVSPGQKFGLYVDEVDVADWSRIRGATKEQLYVVLGGFYESAKLAACSDCICAEDVCGLEEFYAAGNYDEEICQVSQTFAVDSADWSTDPIRIFVSEGQNF